jgi:predicted MFS family arabinose efflux permease
VPRGFGLTLALSMGAGPLALYTLNATAPLVRADLGLSRAQFGSFAMVAFLAAATVSPLVGRYVDLVSGRVVLAVLFAGSGIALVGAAVAWSFAWLLLAVALCGAVQALSNPVTNQLVAAHVPAGRRGPLMGVKQSGVQLSQFSAGLVLPSVAVLLGWRGAAAVAATVAVVGLLLVRSTVPAEASAIGPRHGRRLADMPTAVWWLTGYSLLTGAGLQATNVYLPLYSFERLHLSVRAAGLTAAAVGGVGLVSRIGWGRAAERIRDPFRPLLLLAAASGLAVCAVLAAEQLHRTALMWAGAVVFGASALAANVVVMLALVHVSPLQVIGTASGILAVGMYLGFALGPVSFGLVVDEAGSYTDGWLAVAATYAVAAALALVWRAQGAKARAPAEVT